MERKPARAGGGGDGDGREREGRFAHRSKRGEGKDVEKYPAVFAFRAEAINSRCRRVRGEGGEMVLIGMVRNSGEKGGK